jgi:hypothetical protein
MDCEVGQALLQLEEVGFDKKDRALFYGLSYLRSDLISFRMRRGLAIGLDTVSVTAEPRPALKRPARGGWVEIKES